ncbi:MAG: hypothetical protein QOC72_846, partial [Methylobacteriaceae bacterium]|nr:hypothetical protein [Methylobacteriaceae bacterium]
SLTTTACGFLSGVLFRAFKEPFNPPLVGF